jgi:hypothetical protein
VGAAAHVAAAHAATTAAHVATTMTDERDCTAIS